MIHEPIFSLLAELMEKHNPKPKFRIQWDYAGEDNHVIGFWLWTCNIAAIKLQPSKYYPL